ncbi:MAG: TolC family protein [bacterium]|nr:TolC family protein [bacterium]
MQNILKTLCITILMTFMVLLTGGFSSLAAADGRGSGVLEHYIRLGLENNLALQQQSFSLQKSLQALKEAKGMFLPSVSIEARYSRAGGGREIDILVGDLVNPIHRTLNQLLMAQGLPGGFPANIPNEYIPFLRKEEHETKLRLVQPVFQPGIYYNRKIKKELTGIEAAKLKAFKRQLRADIKRAYYNYLKTLKVKELLNDTRDLLLENLGVSESLFKNHKRTEEVVFRSKAELSKLELQRAEAEKDGQLAAAYFNFLLNRPLDTAIDVGSAMETGGGMKRGAAMAPDLKELEQHALSHREEFVQLYAATAAAGHGVKLHGSAILPNVTAVLDYGFQGEKYSFTGKDDYWMASLVMSWNLYRGGRDKAKKMEAVLEKKRLELQRLELENNIRLQVKEGYYNLMVSRSAVTSTADGLKSREEAFHIISKKYEQDMVPQIEFIKAQNDLTEASVKHIIARFDLYIKEAQLERVSARDRLK